jgi:enoyl-CoA hydratase/carnithine racemase
VAALIAAVFAFGRVASILGTLERLFARLGPHPAASLAGLDAAGAEAAAAGIVHRFVGPPQTAGSARRCAGTGDSSRPSCGGTFRAAT